MSRHRKAIAVLLPALAATSVVATERVPVFVEFRLAVFENEFADPAALEGQAARTVVDALGERIGFVRFEPAPATGPDAYVLRIELRAQEASPNTRLREVGFQARLSGAHVPGEAKTYWMLYEAERWLDPVPAESNLLADIAARVQEVETTGLVERVLRWVRVASDARISDNPEGWELPYGKRELCIETGSLLHFEHDVDFGNQPLLREFEASLSGVDTTFCEPITNREKFAELLDPTHRVRNNRVYIKQYIPLADCGRESAPVPPDVALEGLGDGP